MLPPPPPDPDPACKPQRHWHASNSLVKSKSGSNAKISSNLNSFSYSKLLTFIDFNSLFIFSTLMQ